MFGLGGVVCLPVSQEHVTKVHGLRSENDLGDLELLVFHVDGKVGELARLVDAS